MNGPAPLVDRIRSAHAVANQSGAYPPLPPAGHQTLTEIAAEALGVTLQTPARHSELDVHVSDVKPGSLTDRAIKTNSTKTSKPARIQ